MFKRLAGTYRVVAILGLVLAMGVGTADATGPMPYRKMAQAAGSLLSVRAQSRDQKLQMKLRRAIMKDQGLTALQLSPHVYMKRGFVVGLVNNPSQAEAVMRAARTVQGLRSVEYYLPVRQPSAETSAGSNAMSAVGTTAAIKAAIGAEGLVVTRYEIKVLDGTAVLLGVVADNEERIRVEQAARATDGVTGVKSFLLIVEGPYAAQRPRLR